MEESERKTLEAFYEGLAPEERRARVILKPEFRDAYNEVTQAHRQFPVPEYLWRKWLPVIGPLPVALYLQLRRYCYYNPETGERRDVCWPKQSTLVEQMGIRDRKTLRTALVVLERHGFITRESSHYPDPRSGRPRRGPDKYHVYFEVPLRPDDGAELLMRRMGAEQQGCPNPAKGKFSPLRSSEVKSSIQKGKNSPHGGGEKTDRRNVTRTITLNVDNVGLREGNECARREAAEALALEIGESLSTWAGERSERAHQSEGFHRLVASRMPERLVREALTATRDAVERRRSGHGGCVRGPGAYFAGVVKNLAVANGLDLGLQRTGRGSNRRAIQAPIEAMGQPRRADGTDSMVSSSMSAADVKERVKRLVEMVQTKK